MQHRSLKLLLVFLFATVYACSDKEDFDANENYFHVFIDGEKHYGFRERLSFTEQETCDDKAGMLVEVGEVRTENWGFDLRMMHYKNAKDFSEQEVGEYSIKDPIFSDTFCKLEAVVRFWDYSQENTLTRLKEGGINTVSKIIAFEATDSYTNYAIQGNFTCVFVNAQEEEIALSGKYNLTTIVYH